MWESKEPNSEIESKTFFETMKKLPFIDTWNPEQGKIYFMKKYTLIVLKKGSGFLEIDFVTYAFYEEKVICLASGQYVRFLTNNFEIVKIEIELTRPLMIYGWWVLFKHLKTVSVLDVNANAECAEFFNETIHNKTSQEILAFSINQWYKKNPFKATFHEYAQLFHIKNVVDIYFNKQLRAGMLVTMLRPHVSNSNNLVRRKLRLTVKKMIDNKVCLEGQRKIAFSNKTINEISFELGFKNPEYFHRFFKSRTGMTPKTFRNKFGYYNANIFEMKLLTLIREYHTQEHTIKFYADQLNHSVDNLSRKVRTKMNTTVGQLIRGQLIASAKKLLMLDDYSVKVVATQLGFDEPNNFSAFFKHFTGDTPSSYRNAKRQ